MTRRCESESAGPIRREFREDVMRVARNREPGGLGWLAQASVEVVRAAVVRLMPELAGAPIVLATRVPGNPPRYWHVRTALGDALWRTERSHLPLPGNLTPDGYVDDITHRLAQLGITP